MDPGSSRQHRPRRENLGCFEGGITGVLETERRGRTRATRCTPATVPAAATGEVKTAGEGDTDDGKHADEAMEAPKRSFVGTPRPTGGDGGSERNFSANGCCTGGKRDHIIADCAEKLCRRCSRWGHTSDDVCATEKEDIVLAVTGQVRARDDRGDDGTIRFSGFQGRRDTSVWYDAVRRMRGGELAWQVQDEAWVCDS